MGIGILSPSSLFNIASSVNATSGVAEAQSITTTLTAAGAGNRLVALRVRPTYDANSQTGVSFRMLEGIGDIVTSNDDGAGDYKGLNLIKYGTTSATAGPKIFLNGGRGTIGGETATQFNDVIGSIEILGRSPLGNASAAGIQAVATEAFTSVTNNGTELRFLTTANGTNATTTRFTITGSGELRPFSIHNNGGTGSSVVQSISSGTVPFASQILSSTTNCSTLVATGVSPWVWTRVGNVVTVYGAINLSTSGLPFSFALNLPVATTTSNVSGIAFYNNAPATARIAANTATTVQFAFPTSPGGPGQVITFSYSYEVN